MNKISLTQIAEKHPFPEYNDWWVMGKEFIDFMSNAIVSEWEDLLSKKGKLSQIQIFTTEYLSAVFDREADTVLVKRFYNHDYSQPFHSGEFDALSYSFYRSAYEHIANQISGDDLTIARERRLFSKRVGEKFFSAIHGHLQLDLPFDLQTDANFFHLQENIHSIGDFLVTQGYLRDHFAFTFDVHVIHAGEQIDQDAGNFLKNLEQHGMGYALYEMGYPAILPSAVYLFHTHGEAQHRSSRTIEELFDRMGYNARETDDFDPTGFPSDKVVELWEIRPL